MLNALRDLFASLTPTARFWLALAILAALLLVIALLVCTGGDLAPVWAILSR